MELRNGSLVGGSIGQLPAQLKPAFEEGVQMVLQRWTALCLAVDNEWGGRESRHKAEALYQDVLAWFFDNTDHYADDLEVDLEEIMLADFNTETQDDSPRDIAKELVALHNELITGSSSTLARLQHAAPAAVATSQRQTIDRDGTVMGTGTAESSSESDSDEGMAIDEPPQAESQMQEAKGPIVDEEGFQLVQSRRRGRAR